MIHPHAKPLAALLAALAANGAMAAPMPKPPAFAICSICHKVDPAQGSGVGPNLWHVGGRRAGGLPGYAYSPAMKAAKIVWTRQTLTAFITAPAKVVPGTKMAYAGQHDPKSAAAIVDYLLSLE